MNESERYQRHSLIDWFDQEALRRAHIIVIGAGAVGNEAIKNLAMLGVGHLHLVDMDRIEEHNLTRSVLFRENDIGRFKATVAAERCSELNPDLAVTYSSLDFWDGLTLGEIGAADAVVCCVDNYEARIGLNQLCLTMGTDFYNSGIDSRYVSVEAYPHATNPGSACYECTLPHSAYEAVSRRYSCGWLRKASAEARKIPTTAVTASLAGSLVASTVLNRICGHPGMRSGAIRSVQDTVTLYGTVSEINRAYGCIGCARIGLATVHLRASRRLAQEAVFPLAHGSEGDIELSETALIRTSCMACGSEIEYFESARSLTDAVMVCAYCGQPSIDAEFAHSLPAGEFLWLFSGKEVPGKFLTYRQNGKSILIEMED